MIYSKPKFNGFTLDTCFLIQAYKNPTLISFYFNKGCYGAKIFISEIALNEAEHKGFDKTEILLKMKHLFGKVIVKDVTNEERFFGQKLEKMCSVLHTGDSAILAFTKRTSTCLVTLDKNLAKSCDFFNVPCILCQITQNYGGKY
ncbi:MAG: hypothetical protein O3C04_03605 [Crenarchaeota archaeon]|nr:hypothetical protein [Thermoproteota archaeon]